MLIDRVEQDKQGKNEKKSARLLRYVQSRAEVIWLYLGWRAGLGLLAFWAGVLIPGQPRGGTAPYTPANLNHFTERLLGVWTHWDGEWFLYVAQVGYRSGEATSPFFPLYPVLSRVFATLTGGNYPVGGVLVSLLAGFAVFWLLYELVRRDFDDALAMRSVLYLAIFPTSFFLAAVYSEGLFIALALGAFIAARHLGNFWLAGLLIGLAALTRNIGILLLIPLGYEWLRQSRPAIFELIVGRLRLQISGGRKIPLWQSVAFFGLPAGLLGLWLVYCAVALGDPFHFATVQSSPVWNRRASLPWDTVVRAFDIFLNQRPPVNSVVPSRYREDPNLLDMVFWLFSAGLLIFALWQSWRGRLPLSYLLWFGIAFVVPLLSPAGKEPLLSAPRFILLAFPVFIVLAQAGTRWRWVHYVYLWSALPMLALLFARFANWYWVA
jgi:hypothetical protein